MQNFIIALMLGFFIGGPAWIVLYPHKEVYRTLDIYEEEGGANYLNHSRALIDADFTNIVKPNNDTIYTIVSLNLSDGPLVLDVPAMGDRYWSVQFMATSTDAHEILSRRTRGGDGGRYFLTKEDWSGTVPAGTEHVTLPDSRYWMLARILVDGPKDLANVHAIQDALKLERP